MEQYTINWDNVKGIAPLPHYICNGSNVTVKINDDAVIQISGTCFFPKEDPTLSLRNKVNHFHTIRLLENVVFALNVVWNAARTVSPNMGWEKMESVETQTRIFHPIMIDQDYTFHSTLKSMKGYFKEVTVEILKDQVKYITVITKVIVA